MYSTDGLICLLDIDIETLGRKIWRGGLLLNFLILCLQFQRVDQTKVVLIMVWESSETQFG